MSGVEPTGAGRGEEGLKSFADRGESNQPLPVTNIAAHSTTVSSISIERALNSFIPASLEIEHGSPQIICHVLATLVDIEQSSDEWNELFAITHELHSIAIRDGEIDRDLLVELNDVLDQASVSVSTSYVVDDSGKREVWRRLDISFTSDLYDLPSISIRTRIEPVQLGDSRSTINEPVSLDIHFGTPSLSWVTNHIDRWGMIDNILRPLLKTEVQSSESVALTSEIPTRFALGQGIKLSAYKEPTEVDPSRNMRLSISSLFLPLCGLSTQVVIDPIDALSKILTRDERVEEILRLLDSDNIPFNRDPQPISRVELESKGNDLFNDTLNATLLLCEDQILIAMPGVTGKSLLEDLEMLLEADQAHKEIVAQSEASDRSILELATDSGVYECTLRSLTLDRCARILDWLLPGQSLSTFQALVEIVAEEYSPSIISRSSRLIRGLVSEDVSITLGCKSSLISLEDVDEDEGDSEIDLGSVYVDVDDDGSDFDEVQNEETHEFVQPAEFSTATELFVTIVNESRLNGEVQIEIRLELEVEDDRPRFQVKILSDDPDAGMEYRALESLLNSVGLNPLHLDAKIDYALSRTRQSGDPLLSTRGFVEMAES